MKQQGFNLLELMLTIIVASVVLAIGVPSFKSITSSNRVASQSNSLLAGFRYVRTEAVRRGETVVLCKSTNGSGCNGSASQGYEAGWIAFVDTDDDEARDSDEEIVRVVDAMPQGVTALGSDNVNKLVSYDSDGTGDVAGSAPSGAITITSDSHTRLLCFDGMGRVRIEQSSC